MQRLFRNRSLNWDLQTQPPHFSHSFSFRILSYHNRKANYVEFPYHELYSERPDLIQRSSKYTDCKKSLLRFFVRCHGSTFSFACRFTLTAQIICSLSFSYLSTGKIQGQFKLSAAYQRVTYNYCSQVSISVEGFSRGVGDS